MQKPILSLTFQDGLLKLPSEPATKPPVYFLSLKKGVAGHDIIRGTVEVRCALMRNIKYLYVDNK